MRAEIQVSRDAPAYRRAQEEAKARAHRLTQALRRLPGFEAYGKELLAGKIEELRRLAGGR